MIVVTLIALLATLTGRHIIEAARGGEVKIAFAKCRDYYDATWMWMSFRGESRPPESLKDLEQPLQPGGRRFKRIEKDPWGAHYRIEREDGRFYRIWSNGPDTEPGTDDDICYEPLDEAQR